MRIAILSSILLVAAACESSAPEEPSKETVEAAPGKQAPAEQAPTKMANAEGPQTFGDDLQPSQLTELQSILDEPDGFAGEQVTVEGMVRKACSKKGCWMELAQGMQKDTQGCRVTFKDYGFFVPLDAAGSKAKVQGSVDVRTLSKDDVEHYESEGASFAKKFDDGSAREVRIVATGVELRRTVN